MTTKPWEAEILEWDEHNEAELFAHNISPNQVHQVWENRPKFVPNRKQGSGNWKILGLTAGGRRLTIVLEYDDTRRAIRPITGWDCTPGEKSKYMNESTRKGSGK